MLRASTSLGARIWHGIKYNSSLEYTHRTLDLLHGQLEVIKSVVRQTVQILSFFAAPVPWIKLRWQPMENDNMRAYRAEIVR